MRPAASPRGYPEVLVNALLDSFALPRRRRPLLVGLSGTQASGKSTLAAQLAHAARQRGHPCLVLALDDFYLGRQQRRALAQRVHPLLGTRGVPGTHDIAALRATLRACRDGNAQGLALPRFDKGRDSRLPPSRWRRVQGTPALVILEGWCVGVPPQAPAALRAPVNALERMQDADGRWRRHVQECLRRDYLPAWRLLDRLVLLAAPSFDVVARWRDQAERPLRARSAQGHEPGGDPALHHAIRATHAACAARAARVGGRDRGTGRAAPGAARALGMSRGTSGRRGRSPRAATSRDRPA